MSKLPECKNCKSCGQALYPSEKIYGIPESVEYVCFSFKARPKCLEMRKDESKCGKEGKYFLEIDYVNDPSSIDGMGFK